MYSTIGGNTIVAPVTGPSAQARLERRSGRSGTADPLLLEGINDVNKPGDCGVTGEEQTGEDQIEACRRFTLRAQAHGIEVIATTVTPFGNVHVRLVAHEERCSARSLGCCGMPARAALTAQAIGRAHASR